MQRAKLTDDIDITAMREMEAQGMSRGEIAAALDTTTETLRRYLGPGKRGRKPGSVAYKLPPKEPEYVPSLQERLQTEIEQGKRLPPPGMERGTALKVKQRQTVLEGELGSYTLDLVHKTVTVETVIHGTPASIDDLRRVKRELQQVERELGGAEA